MKMAYHFLNDAILEGLLTAAGRAAPKPSRSSGLGYQHVSITEEYQLLTMLGFKP